jgi:hypothetical protein
MECNSVAMGAQSWRRRDALSVFEGLSHHGRLALYYWRICFWLVNPVEHLTHTGATHDVSNPGEGIKVQILALDTPALARDVPTGSSSVVG